MVRKPRSSKPDFATTPPPPSTLTDTKPFPRLVVFDLDYTLWPLWCDTHVSPPLKNGNPAGTSVRDAHGGEYSFYHEVPGILSALKKRGILIGAASRTSAPEIARQMLGLLDVPAFSDEHSGESASPVPAVMLFDFLEIYPGSKTRHFAALQKRSGVAYNEMLFFDDEARNRNVEELGVVMQLVRNGVTRAEIDRGVDSWRRRDGREGKKEEEKEKEKGAEETGK